MKLSNVLIIIPHIINITIFFYFIIVLIKISALDYPGLLISAFGIFVSLLSGIVSAIETQRIA